MKRLSLVLLALLAVVLVAACGGARSKADQDKDGRVLADAIKSADSGSTFSMSETLVLTGGDIPSGKQAVIQATASGVAKDGNLQFIYRIPEGKTTASFDMIVADGQLYVRPHNAPTWKSVPATTATALFPALRLQLIRESVLLAKSVSGSSLNNTSNGFFRKYAVMPASDQLEQLQSIPLQGSAETVFLKTATAELDAFLSLSGNKLSRLEVHLNGTDPSTGTKQKIDSTMTLKPGTGKLQVIMGPSSATPVSPADILTVP
jgi:hypothetical protein